MSRQQEINTFPEITVKFLKALSKNNSKEWFEKHRDEYEAYFLMPAQMLVMELGEKLRSEVPNIIAVPNINKSIFRIYRDVRFSKDKSPYKTHLAILLWEGNRPKTDCSGFYFQMDYKNFFVGTGIYMFNKDILKKYREIVSNPNKSDELREIFSSLYKNKFETGGRTFKRIPKGYREDIPNTELLLHSGVYSSFNGKISDLYGKDIAEYIFHKFITALPLHQWLIKYLG